MEQLWECPECGVIVKVTEILPPLALHAEKIIERKLLALHINGLDKIMRRFRLGLPFLRLGCWLADMELEVEETLKPELQSVVVNNWYSHQSQEIAPTDAATLDDLNEDFRERRQAVIPATLDELQTELEDRMYCQTEEHANRIADLRRWHRSEKERLSADVEIGKGYSMMWVLKPGRNGQEYQDLKTDLEETMAWKLQRVREEAEGMFRRLYLEYHEEVPGDPPSSEPTYPLRGGIEWKKV